MARDRFPGEAVAAEIHLADGAPDGFPVAVAAGLESLASLADGRVQISDRRITLRGRSLYPETAERMRQRFASVLPAGWDAAIEVRAEPIEKPLEAGLCTDLLNDLARRDPVRFEPKAVEPSPKAAGSLDGLAGVLRRCGGARLRVAVRPESAEDRSAAQALADQRAKALAVVLSSRVPGASLNAAIESAPAKPDSERVAFSVEP
jgi:OOP family OmpA-OmpF porin